jgi:hypothetical protein
LTLRWGKPKTMELPSPAHMLGMQKLLVEILLESGSCREAGS